MKPGELVWVDELDPKIRNANIVREFTSIYRKKIKKILNMDDFDFDKEYVLDEVDNITISFNMPE